MCASNEQTVTNHMQAQLYCKEKAAGHARGRSSLIINVALKKKLMVPYIAFVVGLALFVVGVQVGVVLYPPKQHLHCSGVL